MIVTQADKPVSNPIAISGCEGKMYFPLVKSVASETFMLGFLADWCHHFYFIFQANFEQLCSLLVTEAVKIIFFVQHHIRLCNQFPAH